MKKLLLALLLSEPCLAMEFSTEFLFYANTFRLAIILIQQDKCIDRAHDYDANHNTWMAGIALGSAFRDEEQCNLLREQGRMLGEKLDPVVREGICQKALLDAQRKADDR